jgi:hypothetical protein
MGTRRVSKDTFENSQPVCQKKNEMPSSTVIMYFKKPTGFFTLHKVSVD